VIKESLRIKNKSRQECRSSLLRVATTLTHFIPLHCLIIPLQLFQKHLRWTMPGPASSYSCLEHQRFWNVLNDAKIDPPIQTEYFRSGGATILTFMLDGERAVSSFCIRSAIPGNIVVPPERTTFPYKSRRISRSHLKIELYVVS